MLSHNKIKTYLECKLKYKYQYIDKLPQIQNPAFEFGKIVHTIFELYVQELIKVNKSKDKDILNKIIFNQIIPIDIKDEISYVCNNYNKSFKLEYETFVGTEYNMEVFLEKPKVFKMIIDRLHIDNENKVAKIYDYKTNRLPTDTDLQLAIYAWGVSQYYPDIEKFECYTEYIRQPLYNTKKILNIIVVEQLDKELLKLSKAIDVLNGSRKYNSNITEKCAVCAYRDSCEAVKKLDFPTEDVEELGNFITIYEEKLKQAKKIIKLKINKEGDINMRDGTKFYLDVTPTQVFKDVDAFRGAFIIAQDKYKFLQDKDIDDYIKEESVNMVKCKSKIFKEEEFKDILEDKAKSPILKRK